VRCREKERPALEEPAFKDLDTFPAPNIGPRLVLVKGSPDLAHKIAVDLAGVLEREVPGIDLAEVGREIANQAWAR
jgi:hypothetical protein